MSKSRQKLQTDNKNIAKKLLNHINVFKVFHFVGYLSPKSAKARKSNQSKFDLSLSILMKHKILIIFIWFHNKYKAKKYGCYLIKWIKTYKHEQTQGTNKT